MTAPESGRRAGYAALLVLALAVIAPASGDAYFLNLLLLMLIFIIFASSWNLLALSGQGSLGHAAFFGIGAYASTLIAVKAGLPPLIALPLGGAAAAGVGILIGLTCVRLKEWFLAMVTFGFAIITQTLVVSVLAPVTGGWDGIASPRLVPAAISGSSLIEYYSILCIAALSILAIHALMNSRIGLAFAAIRENETEARASGVDPVRYRLLGFAASAFLAGIAGALEIYHFGYVTPDIFGIDISFLPVIYSIFGGLGTLAGPVIGTVILTIVSEGLLDFGLTFQRFIVIGLVLILVVIFLPRGLVSLPDEVRKRWKSRKKSEGALQEQAK
ncbi:MAG TPA: branched-chain amino acid ABC transporter permease [Methanomicrobiales archaeon]|nr:branched-chain amino acid ABC transporter permease [Methanomicrobiales archaeon]